MSILGQEFLRLQRKEFIRKGYLLFSNPIVKQEYEEVLAGLNPVFIDGLGLYSVESVVCKKELVPYYRQRLQDRIKELQNMIERSTVGLAELDRKCHVYYNEPHNCTLVWWGKKHIKDGNLACPGCGAPAKPRLPRAYEHDKGG